MKKTSETTNSVMAWFDITLNVGMDLGACTLESALENARKLKVADVVGLDGVEVNDYSIKVTGVNS